jgi:hypothetical protein
MQRLGHCEIVSRLAAFTTCKSQMNVEGKEGEEINNSQVFIKGQKCNKKL